MTVLLVLFLGRVVGQILAATTAPRWLPPMARWYSGLMPYRWLLPTQIVFLVLMTAMTIAVDRQSAPLGTLSAEAGVWIVGASYVYALGMVVRSIRYALAPPERRGVLIPIVFHFVLAGFLFAYGSAAIQRSGSSRSEGHGVEETDAMRKLILRMELTLDGVAAGDDGPIDGVDYGDEGSWSDIFSTLETVDAMLIGAGTHREYLGYWQSALTSSTTAPNERRFAEIAARTQHFVLSRTLRTVDWPNASVLTGGVEGIASLKRQSGRDIILWGGPTVAAAAIEAELVDEYHLVTHPHIAGRGKKLFADVAAAHRVRHLGTTTFPSGVVLVKHART